MEVSCEQGRGAWLEEGHICAMLVKELLPHHKA